MGFVLIFKTGSDFPNQNLSSFVFFFQEPDQNPIFVPIFFVELESNPTENEIT